MKMIARAAAAAGLIALAACSGGADDRAAENAEAAAENHADGLDAAAGNTNNETASDQLEERAEDVREGGEEKGESIDDNDGPTNAANGM